LIGELGNIPSLYNTIYLVWLWYVGAILTTAFFVQLNLMIELYTPFRVNMRNLKLWKFAFMFLYWIPIPNLFFIFFSLRNRSIGEFVIFVFLILLLMGFVVFTFNKIFSEAE